jgi:Protein of unknown function (DUF2867)
MYVYRRSMRLIRPPELLPARAHTSRPWRIHQFTAEFRLEDVWSLPAAGAAEDFPHLVERMAASDPARSHSRLPRVLWAIRWKFGELLGVDRPDQGLDRRVPTLRDRLPEDLCERPGPEFRGTPFRSLYQLADEFAAEIANRTVHGVLHLGWVPDGPGRYRAQMAVLVRPNGLLGEAYLAAIKPFRYLIVYPAMMRDIERAWQSHQRSSTLGSLSLTEHAP